MMAFSFRAGTNWCHDFPKLARESGFYFNMHRTRVRVDWNRISSIDIDQVIRERDFLTIDENVNNVVDYSLEREYDVKILDPNFVKLFRLAQLSVEYLLYCKQYLDHSVIILKDELRSKLEENVKLKKELSSAEETMREMKEKFRDKQKYIETKLCDSHGEIHKCPKCPKTFISAVFMNAHVSRRHPNTSLPSSSPNDDHYRAEAEKLHSEIKSLKERLNETERVLRSESGKIFDSAESSRDLRNSTVDRSNVQEKNIEDEHRRCREEISNLKSMLFTEIRSLKERDKRSWDNYECEQTSGNWKELIRQQENEIQRLKDNLKKTSNFDLENIQSKLDAQEKFWQSKIEKIVEEHRIDIEKLYTQLKLNEKSSDEMREDYLKKIEDLHQITKREVPRMMNLKTTVIEGNDNGTMDRQKDLKREEIIVENLDNESTIISNQNKSCSITVSPMKPKDSRDLTLRNRDKQIRSSVVKDDFSKSSAISPRINQWQDQKKSLPSSGFQSTKATSTFFNDDVIQHFNSMSPQKIVPLSTKKKEAFASSSEESQSQSESISSSENSETESGETTETNEEEEEEEEEEDSKYLEDGSKLENRGKSENVPIMKSEEQLKRDIQDNFNQRLKDLGVDPDWRGIPHATFRQLTQIIKHHRNLSSKKFVQFEETRRKIVQDISQKILDNRKEVRKADESVKKSPLNKLMRNVKTKAMKALSINSQENTPRDSEPQKPLINKFNLELLPKKLKSPGCVVKSSLTSPDVSKQSRYTSSPCRKNPESMEQSIDLKQLSHSYESIKDYLKDSGTLSHRMKSPLDFGKPLVTSSPEINGKNFPSRIFSDTTVQHTKPNDSRSLPGSPKNNKSVLKSTAGSTGSLVKKKVFFDLKTEESKSSEKDEELTESDFDVTSISEEKSAEFRKIEVKNPENILLKTSQSEKIAEISRKIETQLSLTRRKPVGAVEAMFTKKLHFPDDEDEKESEHNDPIDFMRSYESKKDTKLPQPAPRASKTQVYESYSKDSNLDKDIEELLLMD